MLSREGRVQSPAHATSIAAHAMPLKQHSVTRDSVAEQYQRGCRVHAPRDRYVDRHRGYLDLNDRR